MTRGGIGRLWSTALTLVNSVPADMSFPENEQGRVRLTRRCCWQFCFRYEPYANTSLHNFVLALGMNDAQCKVIVRISIFISDHHQAMYWLVSRWRMCCPVFAVYLCTVWPHGGSHKSQCGIMWELSMIFMACLLKLKRPSRCLTTSEVHLNHPDPSRAFSSSLSFFRAEASSINRKLEAHPSSLIWAIHIWSGPVGCSSHFWRGKPGRMSAWFHTMHSRLVHTCCGSVHTCFGAVDPVQLRCCRPRSASVLSTLFDSPKVRARAAALFTVVVPDCMPPSLFFVVIGLLRLLGFVRLGLGPVKEFRRRPCELLSVWSLSILSFSLFSLPLSSPVVSLSPPHWLPSCGCQTGSSPEGLVAEQWWCSLRSPRRHEPRQSTTYSIALELSTLQQAIGSSPICLGTSNMCCFLVSVSLCRRRAQTKSYRSVGDHITCL